MTTISGNRKTKWKGWMGQQAQNQKAFDAWMRESLNGVPQRVMTGDELRKQLDTSSAVIWGMSSTSSAFFSARKLEHGLIEVAVVDLTAPADTARRTVVVREGDLDAICKLDAGRIAYWLAKHPSESLTRYIKSPTALALPPNQSA
jgi:hypothetical protein